MKWTIEYSLSAQRQIKKLSKPIADRIWRYLTEVVAVADDPRSLSQAEPLHGGDYRGLYRFRIAKDYRIICDIRDQQIKILVIKIGHRRQVYHR